MGEISVDLSPYHGDEIQLKMGTGCETEELTRFGSKNAKSNRGQANLREFCS
jgi:hypothetical protein